MPSEVRALIRAEELISLEEADGTKPMPQAVTMANGHVVLLNGPTPKEQQQRLRRAYTESIRQVLTIARVRHFGIGLLLLWVLPSMLVYLVGRSAHWVWRGFSPKQFMTSSKSEDA